MNSLQGIIVKICLFIVKHIRRVQKMVMGDGRPKGMKMVLEERGGLTLQIVLLN